MSTDKLNYIAKKLGIDKYKIKYNNIQYYYTRTPELCCKYNLKPISDSIGPYEYAKAIKILMDYYKDTDSTYYNKLHNKALKLQPTLLKDNKVSDKIISEYIKFRPNTYVITLWPKTLDYKMDELRDILQKHGNIYYIKSFKITYNAAKNLIYQLYSDIQRISTINKIEEKLEYIGWKRDERMRIRIIVFENTSDKRISGGQALIRQPI